MASYGWTAYDSRHGGTQTIQDQGNGLNITTEFVKKYEGPNAGNWALRVKGKPRANNQDGLKTRVVFYVAMEGMDKCHTCQLDASVSKHTRRDDAGMPKEDATQEMVNVHVKHPNLGTAEIRIPRPKDVDTVVKSIRPATAMNLWDAKTLLSKVFSENEDSLPNAPGPGSLHFIQFTFQDAFEFDVLYTTQKAMVAMTSSALSSELKNTVHSFEGKFSYVFRPNAPFDSGDHLKFSQSLFSNLQGGLGYFYGNNSVEKPHGEGNIKKGTEGPYPLLTHVPSRSTFPRGFLWDEGFHLLPILEWDADLALEVVHGWLSLMNKDGWIAREQILGAEAESKVPAEFVVQNQLIANPPTLFWIVSKFVDMLQKKIKYYGHDSTLISNKEKGKALVKELYPKLKKHYEWWRKTQAADVDIHDWPNVNKDEGYRWRGRKPGTTFASGLDDYPREEPPDVTELHVDALSWVGVMAETMEKLALYTENEMDILTYRTHLGNIRHNIDMLHWSDEHRMHCDTLVQQDKHVFTCPKGYVALFPFMLGFLGPEHPHLNATLDLIRNPDHLWTDFGVRSLSPDHPEYGKGDNYWRSPIWVNINYMIIERLLYLAQRKGPVQQRCREIYNELRVNVINTVFNSWKDTGYAWEQYDTSGKGQRTAGFTGWTALVVKILAFPELGSGVRGKVKQGLGWAVKEAEQHERWGGAAVLVAVMGMLFIYVTRRKFVGTLRRWRSGV